MDKHEFIESYSVLTNVEFYELNCRLVDEVVFDNDYDILLITQIE